MAIGAAIAGSAILGAVVAKKSGDAQASAAKKAAGAQVESNQANIEFQREVFNQQREDAAPWRDAGIKALTTLQQGMDSGAYTPGDFNFKFDAASDTGYNFRMSEGINALDRSAASRGRLRSGAQDKAVTRFAQGTASQEYGNAFNRYLTQYNADNNKKKTQFNNLAQVSGVGQSANNAIQNASQQMASNVGSSTIASGNAIAQGAINQGNARASSYQGMATAVNQGAQNALLYKMAG